MTAVAETAAAPRETPAIRNTQYLRFLGGATMSALGDQVWYVTLSYVAVRTVSPAAAGMVLSISSVPRLLLVLFGGVIVDRFDARKLMVGSDAFCAAVCLGFAAFAASVSPGLGLLAAIAVVFGVVDAVFLPASAALRPRLLEPHQYSGAAALYTLTGRLALTVGAPLGGMVAASAGLAAALVVDAATFLVSMAALLSVRPRPRAADTVESAKEPFFQSFVAGLAYLRRHAVLGPLMVWLTLTSIGFVGPLNVGAALLATRRGWGGTGIGLLLTGFGVGAALGAVLMTRVRGGLGTWLAVAGALQGAAGASMALVPTLWLAVAATGVMGVLSSAIGIPATVLTQAETDDAFRGRVGSVNTLISLGIVPLTMGLMGAVVGAVGLRAAFGLSGAIEVLGLVCLGSRAFRQTQAPQ